MCCHYYPVLQCRKWAEIKKKRINDNGNVESFKFRGKLLYRCFETTDGAQLKNEQLVVPMKFRENVMKLGHKVFMSGHMGITKTLDRIQSKFLLAKYDR